MNRRGLSFAIDILPDLFLLFALFASTTLAAGIGQLETPDTLPYQATLITNRLLYASHGISYTHPVTRQIRPYIIDAKKFTQNYIDEHLYYGATKDGNAYYAAKITLNDKTIYYNKDNYDRWRPQAGTPTFLGRTTSIANTTTPVLIKEGEDIIQGTLHVEVIARP